MNNKQNKHSRYPLINKHVLNKCERMSELVKEKKNIRGLPASPLPRIYNKQTNKKKTTPQSHS